MFEIHQGLCFTAAPSIWYFVNPLSIQVSNYIPHPSKSFLPVSAKTGRQFLCTNGKERSKRKGERYNLEQEEEKEGLKALCCS